MRFLIDAQLPPALARFLSAAGHTAEHVYDLGMGTASDSRIWDKSLEVRAILVTKDEDFVLRAGLSQVRPTIVWIRKGNTSRRELLNWFEPLLPRVLALVEMGEEIIELAG